MEEKDIENNSEFQDFEEQEEKLTQQDAVFDDEIKDASSEEEFGESFEAMQEDLPQKSFEEEYADVFSQSDYPIKEEQIEEEAKLAPEASFEDFEEDVEQNIELNVEQEFEEEKQTETNELITVRPVKFQEFEDTPPNRNIKKNLDIMQDVSMHISVELGRTKSSIREVMEMEKGSVVELDKIAGEQVEIFVNEKLVAKGEVIVIEDKFGVRVTSTSI